MRKIVRDRILKKCGNRCVSCGATERLEVDHIIPLSKGGEHSEFNFQILCRSCNAKKKDKYPFKDLVSKYFIIDESPEYVLCSKKFSVGDINPKELKQLIKHAFNCHAQKWGLRERLSL